MALYRATKNLIFRQLGQSVIVGETIELDKDYAEAVNDELRLTFPDVSAVLVAMDEAVGASPEQVEKPKKSSTRKPKIEVEPPQEDEVVPD